MTSVVDPVVGADPDPDLPASGAQGPVKGRVARRFFRNKVAVAGLVFVVLLVLMAIFAPLLAPQDPNAQNILNKFQHPGHSGVLGTDDYGRDLLSRLIFGSRVSLQVGIGAVALAAAIGVPLGMVAGMTGRRLDSLLSRINEAFLVVPGLLFIFTMLAVLGRGMGAIIVSIGALSVPSFFRVTRATTLDVKGETYIEASRSLGCTRRRVILHHVLPNILAPLVVRLATGAGGAVTVEATLSFLGLGVNPPTATWGNMLTSGQNNIRVAPYLVYYPGIMIALTVLSFLLIGDGVRRAMGTTRDAVGQG